MFSFYIPPGTVVKIINAGGLMGKPTIPRSSRDKVRRKYRLLETERELTDRQMKEDGYPNGPWRPILTLVVKFPKPH